MPKHSKRLFCSLPAGVQYKMIDDRMIFSVRRFTVRQWTGARAHVRRPILLQLILGISLTCAILGTLAGAGYRALGSWFGANVGAPEWLNMSTRYVLGILLVATLAIIFFIISEESSNSRLNAMTKTIDAIAPFVLWVALAALVLCLGPAVVAMHDYIGWEATAIVTGTAVVSILGLTLVVRHRNSRIRNPFRTYLTNSPEELMQDLLKYHTPNLTRQRVDYSPGAGRVTN